MVGVIMKFPSVLVYHAVVSSVDPSGGGLVSIGVDLPDYLDDVGVLGFIRDRLGVGCFGEAVGVIEGLGDSGCFSVSRGGGVGGCFQGGNRGVLVGWLDSL